MTDSPLNLCPIYLKLLEHVATHDSWSDFTLTEKKVHPSACLFSIIMGSFKLKISSYGPEMCARMRNNEYAY